jgi:phosphatidylglycerol:prolipoprotein diacylglycerol transferase
MYPVICQLGPLTIYSYGLMLAVAVIVCGYLLARDANKEGIATDVIYDFIFLAVLSGIIGARVFFIVLHWDFYAHTPIEIIMVQNGGLSWQGGLVLGSLAGLWFVRKKGLPLTKILDLIAPYLALGQAIGRLGCFLNGCCFGKPVVWGIYFPVHDAHLHPTQLYCAFGLLMLFFVLKYLRRVPHIPGSIFVYYLMFASVLRFMVEFVRDDHLLVIAGLSIYQIVCIFIFLVAIYVYTRLKSHPRT